MALPVIFLMLLGHAATGVGFAQAEEPSHMSVLVGGVLVEGGFQELTGATEELTSHFVGRRSTVEELYELAQGLELLYQEAGYFLVRVTIPPQEVNDGDTLRLLVVDGYLEDVDLQGVPERSRAYVESLLKPMVNRQQLTMDDFERVLMLVNKTPGVTVRTTLAAGEGVGSSVLVVEGEHSAFSGSARFNTRASAAGVTPWSTSANVQLNQLFGRGEQLSANVSGPVSSLLSPMGPNANHRSVGGDIRWPLNNDGESLHIGYSQSHTYTPIFHFLIPATESKFQRITVQFTHSLQLSRTRELSISGTLEATDDSLVAPDFQTTLHQDRLRVIRVNVDSTRETQAGLRRSLSWQLSQGTTWGARTTQDVLETGIPFSRIGANPTFRKLSMTASWRWPFAPSYTLTSTLRGQYALAGPLPTAELFHVNGGNAFPSLALGIAANDHGWTLRNEVDTRLSLFDGTLPLTVFAYIAVGATNGDMIGLEGFASAAGVGLRGEVGRVRLSLDHGWGWSEFSSDDAFFAGVEVFF